MLPRKSTTPNVGVEVSFTGSIEQIPVADETHPVDMIVIFIIIRFLAEK
jgi:hypothetical protein